MATSDIKTGIKGLVYKGRADSTHRFFPRILLGLSPHNTDVGNFYMDYQKYSDSSYSHTTSTPPLTVALGETISYTSTTDNFVINAFGYLGSHNYKSGSYWEVASYHYLAPMEMFLTPKVSTVFLQNTEPTSTLTFDEGLYGSSSTQLQVALLSNWLYNKTDKHSLRIAGYVIKIIDSGANGEGSFVFKRVPYPSGVTGEYLQTTGVSMYSETHYVYRPTAETITFYYGGLEYGYADVHNIPGLWAEVRRVDPDDQTQYVTLLLHDDTHLSKYAYHCPLEYEETEYELSIPSKQVTWMNGNMLVLGKDMKIYRLMPDSTMVELYETDFETYEDVMLVAHPDQDYAYLIGGSKQIIINSSLNVSVSTEAWSGLEDGLLYTNFDVEGNIWVGNTKRSKSDLSTLYTHSVPAVCCYTYLAGNDGVAYSLEGDAYTNVASSYITNPWLSGLIWKYPQAVRVPYNHNDFQMMTEQDIWWGINHSTGEFEEYTDGNAIPIPATDSESGLASVEIMDGVELKFDDDGGAGSVIAGEYYYFTVAIGAIKDRLNQLHLKFLADRYDYRPKTLEMTITSTTTTIPEAAHELFLGMNTTIYTAKIDGVACSVTTSDTTPSANQVYINSSGTINFNSADIGRIFSFDYYVYYEVV